ncbi:MAG TPA: hypothetical protein VIA82_00805 [Candidatus Limnocylindria bacterium]|jgi:hypothetical protein
MPRRDLDRLTRRWQQRHDARRAADPSRPRANPGREALAKHGFPYESVSPAEYVAQRGEDMPGFTYDDESYADPALDAWIVEVGRLLRERREAASAPTAAPKPRAKPKARPKPGADG